MLFVHFAVEIKVENERLQVLQYQIKQICVPGNNINTSFMRELEDPLFIPGTPPNENFSHGNEKMELTKAPSDCYLHRLKILYHNLLVLAEVYLRQKTPHFIDVFNFIYVVLKYQCFSCFQHEFLNFTKEMPSPCTSKKLIAHRLLA